MLTFTTLIPNLQGGELLGRALDSVLEQTLPPTEVIVVDHGSTDVSLELIARFEKSLARRAPMTKFRLIQYPSRLPVAENWNRAASSITTDYFHIFHADDELGPSFYERCFEEIGKFPQTDYLSTKIAPIDADSKPTSRPRNRVKDPLMAFARFTGMLRGRLFLLFFGVFGTMLYCPTVIFRRKFFEHVGGFSSKFSLCVDFEMWVRCIRAGGRYLYLPEPLYRYRISEASIAHSQRFDARYFEEEFRAYHLAWARRPWLNALSIPILTAVFLEDLLPLDREQGRAYTAEVCTHVGPVWSAWLRTVAWVRQCFRSKHAVGAVVGAVLLFALLAVRLPFLKASLCGEEGIFAHAVVNVAEGRKPRLLVARDLKGAPYEVVPEHNLGGYVLPGLLFKPFYAAAGLPSTASASRIQAGRYLRFVFVLLYLGAVSFAIVLLPTAFRVAGAAFIALFSVQNLPFLASIQIQYDGAVSTLLLTLAVLFLVRGFQSAWKWKSALFVAAGVVAAMGKVEYLLVGFATAATGGMAARGARAPILFLVGGLAGSFGSYVYDAPNFIGGFEVLERFLHASTSGASGRTILAWRLTYLREFTKELQILIVGIFLAAWLIRRNRRWKAMEILLPFAAAVFVTLAYLLIAWPGDGFPRYFAPAFLLLPIAIAQLSVPKKALVPFLLFAAFEGGAYLKHSLPQTESVICGQFHTQNISRLPPEWVSATQSRGCVAQADGAVAFYFPELPFVCCGFWDDPRAIAGFGGAYCR